MAIVVYGRLPEWAIRKNPDQGDGRGMDQGCVASGQGRAVGDFVLQLHIMDGAPIFGSGPFLPLPGLWLTIFRLNLSY